jgi:tetratricopeptide (TPR) repeat protein
VAAAGGPLKGPAAIRAGRILVKYGKPADALAHFDAVAGDREYASEALVGRGRALLMENKYDDALESLRKAPDYPADTAVRAEGYSLAGDACYGKGDFKGAIVEYTKATLLGDSDFKGPALFGAASSYAALGEKDKALAAYRKYLDAYPEGSKSLEAKEAIKKLEG